jgi:hypothetical protein
MSRLFDDASSQFLSASAPVTAMPLSMACWFYSDSIALTQTLMNIGDSTAASNRQRFKMAAAGAVAGDPIRGFICTGAAQTSFDTTAGYTANAWHHACTVFTSNVSRAVYLNGANKTSNTADRTPGTPDVVSIGRTSSSASDDYTSGRIADAAVWNIALSDDDVAALADGLSPLLVRPDGLVAYWPIFGNTSPEIDIVGGFGATVTGATKDDHPRIILPGRPRVFLPEAAAPASPVTSKHLLLLGVGV